MSLDGHAWVGMSKTSPNGLANVDLPEDQISPMGLNFGVPKETRTDGGSQFMSKRVAD